MRRDYTVRVAGQYRVVATANGGLRVYRDRTRLVPHHGDTVVHWSGRLEQGDLIEAEAEGEVSLEVLRVDQTPA